MTSLNYLELQGNSEILKLLPWNILASQLHTIIFRVDIERQVFDFTACFLKLKTLTLCQTDLVKADWEKIAEYYSEQLETLNVVMYHLNVDLASVARFIYLKRLSLDILNPPALNTGNNFLGLLQNIIFKLNRIKEFYLHCQLELDASFWNAIASSSLRFLSVFCDFIDVDSFVDLLRKQLRLELFQLMSKCHNLCEDIVRILNALPQNSFVKQVERAKEWSRDRMFSKSKREYIKFWSLSNGYIALEWCANYKRKTSHALRLVDEMFLAIGFKF